MGLAYDYKTKTNIYVKYQHGYKSRNLNYLDEFSVMDEVIFTTMKSLFLILKTTVQVLRIWCAMCVSPGLPDGSLLISSLC